MSQPRNWDPPRKPYQTPKLREHGSVERLTKSGLGTKVEGHKFDSGSKIPS